MDTALVPIIVTVITAATPLVFAALGELVVEKAGVLNLGVEGMMLIGAISAFATGTLTGSGLAGCIAAVAAGTVLSLLFGFICLTLRANQVATGLALTLFGTGVAALAGQTYVGIPFDGLAKLAVPGLSDVPVLGPLLFRHDALIYLSVAAAGGVWYFLYRTRAGMILRAVGESHDSAHALGYPVIAIRYGAIAFGGALCGLGGAYLSLAYSPMWAENMTAGRGWIALALVVFATWKPWRVLAGAYLFGGVTILQLHAQGMGIDVASQWLSMLPYLATIAVLVIISRDKTAMRLHTPACLGRTFHPAR
ncbi:MAG: ABC transporter permease [Gammaproteobacteria bacterium]|nr:ABC transporter permease [Gammaproteobacteria bacterium]